MCRKCRIEMYKNGRDKRIWPAVKGSSANYGFLYFFSYASLVSKAPVTDESLVICRQEPVPGTCI